MISNTPMPMHVIEKVIELYSDVIMLLFYCEMVLWPQGCTVLPLRISAYFAKQTQKSVFRNNLIQV